MSFLGLYRDPTVAEVTSSCDWRIADLVEADKPVSLYLVVPETARQLLTPGEVMQLPNEDEIILVSGLPPIRANKIRYYSDKNFKNRVSPAPVLNGPNHPYSDCPPPRRDDWGCITAEVNEKLYKAFNAELINPKQSETGGKERKPQLAKKTDRMGISR